MTVNENEAPALLGGRKEEHNLLKKIFAGFCNPSEEKVDEDEEPVADRGIDPSSTCAEIPSTDKVIIKKSSKGSWSVYTSILILFVLLGIVMAMQPEYSSSVQEFLGIQQTVEVPVTPIKTKNRKWRAVLEKRGH